MKELIHCLPKAELHLHIEGTLGPELMFALAQRNHIDLPYRSIDELRRAYQFGCLQDFLDIYYQGAGVLLHERDFYALARAYFEKCAQQNITHTEIMFDPQTHTARGIEFATVINGLHRAAEEAREKWGISSFFIMSFLRHLTEEAAFETLEQSKPHFDKIKAVGLDSSEKGNPPRKFKNVFEEAIQMGYIPLAHAGEEGDADYVWEALDLLRIVRIDHGNNAMQDPDLVREIVRRDMALTVCPLSNVALKVVADIRQHPLKRMMDCGLKVTVNSDDPAYFGGQLCANLEAVQAALDLTTEDIYTLLHNAFRYSLLADGQKAAKIAELEEAFAAARA